MKLAIIGTRGIPAKYGGFETNVEKTAPYLVEKGIDVSVYCRYKNHKPSSTNYLGVNLVYLSTINVSKIGTLWHTFKSLVHACLADYDLIHVYNVGNGPLMIIPRILVKRR